MEEISITSLCWGNEGQSSFTARIAISTICVKLQYQYYSPWELNSHTLDVIDLPH